MSGEAVPEAEGVWQLKPKAGGVLQVDFTDWGNPGVHYSLDFEESGSMLGGLDTCRLEEICHEIEDVMSLLSEEGGVAVLQQKYGQQFRQVGRGKS
jgi:hypothetical protein